MQWYVPGISSHIQVLPGIWHQFIQNLLASSLQYHLLHLTPNGDLLWILAKIMMQRVTSCTGNWKKRFQWSDLKVYPMWKRWLCHFKQVHLQPCSGSTMVIQKLSRSWRNQDLLEAMSTHAIVYVALHVDNYLMKGDIEAIGEVITAFKEDELVIKIMEEQ